MTYWQPRLNDNPYWDHQFWWPCCKISKKLLFSKSVSNDIIKLQFRVPIDHLSNLIINREANWLLLVANVIAVLVCQWKHSLGTFGIWSTVQVIFDVAWILCYRLYYRKLIQPRKLVWSYTTAHILEWFYAMDVFMAAYDTADLQFLRCWTISFLNCLLGAANIKLRYWLSMGWRSTTS